MDSNKVPIILCIDDDKEMLLLLESYLSSDGYQVLTAQNAQSAFLQLQDIRPALILLDIIMPEMDGYTVCRKIQQDVQLNYLPIIFLTAMEGQVYKSKAFSLGAAGYVTKPVDRKNLLLIVEKVLETGKSWPTLKARNPKNDMWGIPALEILKILPNMRQINSPWTCSQKAIDRIFRLANFMIFLISRVCQILL